MRALTCVFATLGWMVLVTEATTTWSCSDGYYQCNYDGRCIPNVWVCDGYPDCSYYGDDEQDCLSTNVYTTEATTTWSCSDGFYPCNYDGRCIPDSWVCDGYPDCSYYGDDEQDCLSTNVYTTDATTGSSCPDNYYQCQSGSCIPDSWVCDGHIFCPFGDDELDCYSTTDYPTTTTSSSSTSTRHPPPVECASTFEYIYDRCVLVDPFTHTSWDEARYLCEKFDSDLVVLYDYNFYAELLQYIKNKGLDSHDYWVGATDKGAEGVWQWVDSSRVPSGAPLWALYGCTNDYHLEPRPSDAQSQDCGYLDKDRGLYMSDASCDESFATICQASRSRKETKDKDVIAEKTDP